MADDNRSATAATNEGQLRGAYYARAMDRTTEAEILGDDDTVSGALAEAGFKIINPYRREIDEPIDSHRLVERNHAMICEAFVLLANLSRPSYPYAGVWFEMAQAYALGIPVIAWVGSTGYERHHYLKVHSEFICEDLATVVEYLKRACTVQGVEALLTEAKAYYDAIAPSYAQTSRKAYRGGQDPQYARERQRLADRLVEYCSQHDVLELGCGDGDWTQHIAKSAKRIRCVDASLAMIDQAKRRLTSASLQPEFVQCDLFDQAMRFDGYDVVVCFFLLGFMPRSAQRTLLKRIGEACAAGTIVLFGESVRQASVPSKGMDAVRLQERHFDGRPFVVCKEVFSGRALAARVTVGGLTVVEEFSPASWFSFCAAQACRS